MLNGRDISQNMTHNKIKTVKFIFHTLRTFPKNRISPNLTDIFKFGFNYTKRPEIHFNKQLSFKNCGNFLLKILHGVVVVNKWLLFAIGRWHRFDSTFKMKET
jgi:hypothetical protein